MKMDKKMFNRQMGQLIITFAFYYSALICHLKAMELFEKNENLLAFFLWFCAFTSLMGGLRFQIAKIVYKLRKKSDD